LEKHIRQIGKVCYVNQCNIKYLIVQIKNELGTKLK